MWPCSSGTDGLDGPPTGRRAAAGELNYTLNWVGFDSFIRTHLDIPSARFSPSTQRESREGFHGARLDTRSSTTGETGDQNNNATPDWLSVSPTQVHTCSLQHSDPSHAHRPRVVGACERQPGARTRLIMPR